MPPYNNKERTTHFNVKMETRTEKRKIIDLSGRENFHDYVHVCLRLRATLCCKILL